MTENLSCQTLPRFIGRLAICCQLFQNKSIISWIYNNRHAGMIFSRRAQHRGATDVNIFHRVRIFNTRLENGFFKRIKVDHDQVNKVNLILLGRLQVAIQIPTSQEAAVNIRMESLDTTIHHLWKTSHIIYSNGAHSFIV